MRKCLVSSNTAEFCFHQHHVLLLRIWSHFGNACLYSRQKDSLWYCPHGELSSKTSYAHWGWRRRAIECCFWGDKTNHLLENNRLLAGRSDWQRTEQFELLLFCIHLLNTSSFKIYSNVAPSAATRSLSSKNVLNPRLLRSLPENLPIGL